MSAPGRSVIVAENRNTGDPECHSIMNSDYPLFSLHCSALPQTRFTFPNFFGHKTLKEAHELFTTFLPVLNYGCFSQMPKFLCPLFFPPCNDERVLPCASFCRGKAHFLLYCIVMMVFFS